jgi:hypothetical protein
LAPLIGTALTKSADEIDDEFNRRKYAMEDNVQSILVEGPMTSIYRMTLPFKLDPSVTRIRFLGTTSDGCWFAHVDLAEKKEFEVEKVIMIDTKKRLNLPSSAKKRNYHSL